MNKRKLTLFLFLIIIVLNIGHTYAAPDIIAPNAILMDYETGEVLFEKNAHKVTYPASITKILTAIIALENTRLDDIVTVDYDLFVGGASMYIAKGESFTIEELLRGLMIRSGNDAGEVLARHISGSVEEFSKLMNKRALELGAKNTHFTNPHGMPDANHVTTAYDLAVISRHAMKFDIFREIVKSTHFIIPPTEQTINQRTFKNTNRFLWGTGGANQILYNGKYIDIKYDIVDGIKTGYTSQALNCLATSATKEGHTLIAIVLGAHTSLYLDSRRLLDYGYSNYKSVLLTEENQLELEAEVKGGKEDTVALYTSNKLTKVFPRSTDTSNITKEIEINENITAPINTGDKLGKVVYYLNGEALGEVELVAQASIEKRGLIPSGRFFRNLSLFILAFILWQAFVAYMRFQKRRRRLSFGAGRSPYGFSKSILKKR